MSKFSKLYESTKSGIVTESTAPSVDEIIKFLHTIKNKSDLISAVRTMEESAEDLAEQGYAYELTFDDACLRGIARALENEG